MNDKLLIKEAEAYRERLEARLRKTEHAVCVVAQTVYRVAELMIEYLNKGDKQINFYSKSLLDIVSDLQPEPDTPAKCYNGTKADPRD